MPSTLRLRTNDPVIEQRVGEWLRDSRLALPAPVDLDVQVGALPEIPPDLRPVYTQGRVASRSGAATDPVTLEWGPGLGYALLEPGSTTARVWVTNAGVALFEELCRAFLLNVCVFLVRRAGLHHVHGATLSDPLGNGWLLVGDSGSGKSTTTVLLARTGWRVGTDDIAFLTAGHTPGRTDMIGWRERLALRHDAAAIMANEGGVALDSRRKTGWFAEELGAGWVGRITPKIIGFTRLGTTTTSAAPVSARDALTRIMQCSPWVMLEANLADEHLGLMSALVAQARSYEITLGKDLFARPDILLEQVA